MQADIVGNNIMRFQRNGFHILFPGQQVVYNKEGDAIFMPVAEGVSEHDVIIPRRTHPCFPNFGAAPKNYPKIPQHGWLRDADAELRRYREFRIEGCSEIGGSPQEIAAGYPWKIVCTTTYTLEQKAFEVRFMLSRMDKMSSSAPFNLAMHWYWMNMHGMKANLPGYEEYFRCAQKESSHFPAGGWDDPVLIKLNRVCKIRMMMDAPTSSGGEREIVAWSDDPRFFCFEQSLDKRKNFGTTKGLHLDSTFSARFRLEFE